LGRFGRRDIAFEPCDLCFELCKARGRRLESHEERRPDPAFTPVGEAHAGIARVALENLDRGAADEVIERPVARIRRRMNAEAQAVGDIGRFGKDRGGAATGNGQ